MRDWLDSNPFRPRFPWYGPDLQTVRNFLTRHRAGLDDWPSETLRLAMADGSGDRLLARLHRPAAADDRPLVVLIHGLSGCEDSAYVRESARNLLAAGYPVLRLNLRGAGPSRPLCRWGYHAGRSEDLAQALAELPAGALRQGAIAVGYSLGGGMLAKYLAEQGSDGPVRAAVCVSAPIDLAAAARCMLRPRNWAYHRFLLGGIKREALAGPLTNDERAAVLSAASVIEFDDTFVAPRNGFAGVADYYARCQALRFLGAAAVPTLVLHARDDPWIPASAYTQFDWRANRHLILGLTEGGGHVGFHGRGSRIPWHDRAVLAFLRRHVGHGREEADPSARSAAPAVGRSPNSKTVAE